MTKFSLVKSVFYAFFAWLLSGALLVCSPKNEGDAGVAKLEPCSLPGIIGEARCGTYTVYEDRASRRGRQIDLNIVVLAARSSSPLPDPVFVLAGGPGQAATTLVRGYNRHPLRAERDIVFVDQRGTGGSNPLDCDVAGSDDDVQGYLDIAFKPEDFIKCRDELLQRADLKLYTTPIAIDDFDEVAGALGYEKVNLIGGSYGTRAALVFMRRHLQRIRSVVLNSVAPIANKLPLNMAKDAQAALDLLFEDCRQEVDCNGAFPSIAAEFQTLLERLSVNPVEVAINHPANSRMVTVTLDRDAFSEAVRVMMYQSNSAGSIPYLIHEAFKGDYTPFADFAIRRNRQLRGLLSLGMLLSVVCASDLPRISEEEIAPETDGTFIGDTRMRTQKAVCDIWPTGQVPNDFGSPVQSDIPTLIISGSRDPVTPPRWGEMTAGHLSNSRHLIVPAAHVPRGPCIRSIIEQFITEGSIEHLDTDCTKTIELPQFRLN